MTNMTSSSTSFSNQSSASSATFKQTAVIGSGAMGRGIVQLLAQSGYAVKVVDTNPRALDAAMAYLRDTFQTLASKGKLSIELAQAATARCSAAHSLSELKDCDLVIEAIVERLDVKQSLFKELESIVRPDAVIASNTSSLSITALASSSQHPERIAGLHFFNPVPLMRVVEVVRGLRSSEQTVQSLLALVSATGHRGVACVDAPGFIVNHAGRGYGTESLKTLSEGVADIPGIDAILKEQVMIGNSGGFKLGPFELMDLTGLDVSHPVMESIYGQFYQEPRFRPSYLTAQRVSANVLGRKTSEGFYQYPDGKKQDMASRNTVSVPSSAHSLGSVSDTVSGSVWVAPGEFQTSLQTLFTELGASLEHGDEPSANAIVVLAPLGLDCSTALSELCAAMDLSVAAFNPARVIALDPLMPLGYKACQRRVLMRNPATSQDCVSLMLALLGSDGCKVSVIDDSPGFVSQRVIAMIVAIGCEIAQQQIASPADIDDAVRLGLGYPQGPLSMGDTLGAMRVVQVLQGMHYVTGDPRYRPSLWLQRRAQLGLSLLKA